ncbi:MAG: hypothetical protein ACYC0T_05590 [Ramlibacter sp.]
MTSRRPSCPSSLFASDEHSPISILNFNGVGGGTILYAAHFPRLHPSDFRVRSLDGVADDWPIDYSTLEPWYAVNDHHMGVAGLAGDPAYPPHQPPLPPVPLGRLGETMARGFNRLGWHWWPSEIAIATREHEGRAPCINLGTCKIGCAQGARGTVDVTYWPLALRHVEQVTAGLPAVRDGLAGLEADAIARYGSGLAALDHASRSALVDEFAARHPTVLQRLGLETVTCYYQQDGVLERLGLEARPPYPMGHQVPPGDLTLLKPVIARGRIYRDAS